MAELIDTVLTVGWALAAWIVLTALAAALALHTVFAVVWWAGRAASRACAWLYARLPASRAPQALPEGQAPHGPSRARTARPVPSWAHTQPHTHEEAA
ncbi:hypothetical protein [Streptomyces chartreusis]|uniref:hypothetical protein n=1 Tax=Streptomyces chartreusis TaxID=1969 RepID=UPI00381BF1B3